MAGKNTGILVNPHEFASSDLKETAETVLSLIDPLSVGLRFSKSPRDQSHYGAVIHAQLCRLRLTGLSNVSAAQAAGIGHETLKSWCVKYPQLESDLEQAAQLANAEAARLLWLHMGETGPIGLNAVKFFLSTHAKEFRERAVVELESVADDELIKKIGASLYGLDDE